MEERWFCAQAKAGRVDVAIRGLDEQGFSVFYPMMLTQRSLHGRWIDTREAVFPNYLFVHSEPEPERWRAINCTRGISKLLGNDHPSALQDREIEALQFKERTGQLRHPRRRAIRTGDVVEFKVGSFVGLQGVVQWTRRERIGILLSILGGDTVATAPRDWLKLASA